MLPAGLTADLASPTDQRTLKSIHPGAQTVAVILAGRCSCDLIRSRLASTRDDERHLRDRYRRLGVPRARVIAALERHRRGASREPPPEGWPDAFAAFVAEHARNAGPSLYHLHFAAEATPLPTPGPPRRVTAPLVTATPSGWLAEGQPTIVGR